MLDSPLAGIHHASYMHTSMHCWLLHCQQAKSFGMQPVFLTKATWAFSSSWLQLESSSAGEVDLGLGSSESEGADICISSHLISTCTNDRQRGSNDLRHPTPWLSELKHSPSFFSCCGLRFAIKIHTSGDTLSMYQLCPIHSAPAGLYQLLPLDG